ncbi:hypothetical protein A2886_02705 [candidate division WWE3 bacterium RIFCSPHIGHO2_01_FULL_42_13]|uniref:Glycoside hydrolase family 42 N-terminal domain-containing protein n=1 Tax=candidate division WWE3 bacterium RIFCSPHIGHO2_01_FULL_42_13 TaxID=1802617 RepID=A0A1F4URS6_UNCKA|nr:MAG: hypothetical protein A2886_02705 [candidate division WWE3 bacterium RIFCSPHIGHO2_01_FULL_42_13]
MIKLLKRKTSLRSESAEAEHLLFKLLKNRVAQIILVVLLIITLGPVLLFLYLRPTPQQNINYGITFSNKYSNELGLDWQETYIKILDDLGADNLRLVAYWDDVEAVQNVYDFSDIKWQLDEAQKRNIPVIMTIGRKVPRYPECFEPTWWKETENADVRKAELFEYIKVAVNELKGYSVIDKWQVENEPFFPFGECKFKIDYDTVKQEAEIVRGLDERPIVIQDSGEGGYWRPTYALGDYLAISMYRKIWYDFWGALDGNFIYFQYPLAHWTYKIKADLTGVPYQKIIVTELQGEPWGPKINSELSQKEKDKSMSRNDFWATLSYAQQSGFKDLYVWGVEWWLWEKEVNNNPFFWDTAKALFN